MVGNSVLRRRLVWAAAVSALVLSAIVIWRAIRPATPDDAAKSYVDRVLDGDIDWIFAHLAPEERSLVENPRLMKEFYREFIGPKVKNSYLAGGLERRYGTQWKSFMKGKLRMSDGKTATIGVVAFVEDGQMVVSGWEMLLYTASAVNHPELTDARDQAGRAFRDYTPWLVSHGVTRIYDAQGGTIVPIAPRKPAPSATSR
jgi:hypothetical protein